MSRLYPVVLAGGSGTRLWPVSRRRFPKQFSRLVGDRSPFQATLRRLSGDSFEAPIIVTGEDFHFVVAEQIAECELEDATLLVEPEGRNTAPAALVAALFLRERDPEATLLLAPSDHAIPDAAAFRSAILRALPAARDGRFVTFGIRPTRAETGYGYLETHPGCNITGKVPVELRSFVEKPDAATAAHMVDSGRHLWNSGVFLMSVQSLVEAFEIHAHDLLARVTLALASSRAELGVARLDARAWSTIENISIDRAIMEKAGNLSVMPYDGEWSDLGSWQSVWQGALRDASGNAVSATATAIACRDSLLRSDSGAARIVGIGLEGIVAVATRDAVLVARADQSQKVRDVVERLRQEAAPEADSFPFDHRPWGSFESLAKGDRFQVKRIVVKPGGVLSLQSHLHRAEHWIVVAGTAKVTIGDEVTLLSENQSIYVPLGEKHRLENPGKVPMVLIEVQTGTYLGEDDIVRYDDVYARK